MPAALKNVGIVLTFSGAAPALDSHSDDGVRKSSYETKYTSAKSLAAGIEAAPWPGSGTSARVHAPLSKVCDARRLRTLSRVSTSTRSRVEPTPASETRSEGSKRTCSAGRSCRKSSTSPASSVPERYVLPPTLQSVRSEKRTWSLKKPMRSASSGISRRTSRSPRCRNVCCLKNAGTRITRS